MEFPFGMAGLTITAIALFFVLSYIITKIMEKKGIKPTEGRINVEDNSKQLIFLVIIVVILIDVFTLYFLKESLTLLQMGELQIPAILAIAITALIKPDTLKGKGMWRA